MSGKKEALAENGKGEAKAACAVNENLFSKEQLLCSEKFSGRKDALNALLKNGELYSVSTAEKTIEKFMKGQVK